MESFAVGNTQNAYWLCDSAWCYWALLSTLSCYYAISSFHG